MKKRKTTPRRRRPSRRVQRPAAPAAEPSGEGESREGADQAPVSPELGPRLTGGDVDADWLGASTTGEEAVGGSVATPDQDVVDALGEALGVPQESDAEVQMSGDMLRERDLDRWRLEREAAREEEA